MDVQPVVGVPSRPPLPLIGHGMELIRRPLEFFGDMYRQPEPIVRIQLGRKQAYVLTAPELMHQIMRGKEAHSVGKGEMFKQMRIIIGDGLATCTEPKHMKHRRLMQPAFHRDILASYIAIMREEINTLIDSWQNGQCLEFHNEMEEISIRIASRSLFSSDLAREVVAETERCFPICATEFPKRAFLPWLAKVPFRNREFNAAVKKLRGMTMRLIAEYRASGEDHGDMVSMLMAARFDDGSVLTDEELLDEVMTFYAASWETTTNLLTFAVYAVHHNRRTDIREKMEQEVAEVLDGGPVTSNNIRQLVYTERVVAETLRRHTPFWLNMREAMSDIELAGHPIPAGSPLIFSAYCLHNHPDYFPEPEEFDPDRWTMEYRKKVTRSGIFQPFGSGRHTCIGEAFAWFEAVTVLATLTARVQLEPLVDKPLRILPRITLAIKELPIKVHKRDIPLNDAKF